jgi:diguanylate cyclase (GGDEF)-like protein
MSGKSVGRKELSRADERLAGLVRLVRVLARARSHDDVAERAADEARFAFGARSVSVSRLEREHGLARVIVNVGSLPAGVDRFPETETYRFADSRLISSMVDRAEPWLVRADEAGGDQTVREMVRDLGGASALAVPLIAERRVWGALVAVRDDDEYPFGEDDLAFAQAFAGIVSAGLAQVEHLAGVERMAYSDALTGLGNRRLVEETIEEALSENRADGRPVTVVMADVNRLKQANDAHGHEAGDQALLAVAEALSVATGKVPGAVAGRIGGDEFCAVLPGYGLDIGEALASAFLRGMVGAPFGIGVACGVASTELDSRPMTAMRLFALADAAQYEAKREGADHAVVADPSAVQAERRLRRGQPDEPGLLAVALAALADLPDRTPAGRIAAAADALASSVGAAGWIVSRLRAGAAMPMEYEVERDGVLVSASIPAPKNAPWVAQAAAHGTVVLSDDEDVPLAAVRGVAKVVAAVSGDWLVELLCDAQPLPADTPGVLRAALGVALSA